MRRYASSIAHNGIATSIRHHLRLSIIVLTVTFLIAGLGILPGCAAEPNQMAKGTVKSETERLIGELYSADVYTRTAAAQALGQQKETQAVEPLIEYLKDGMAEFSGYTAPEEIAFLQTVITALGAIGDERAVAPLVDIQKSEEDDGIRFGAASCDALIMIGEGATEPLIASMEGEDADYTRKVLGLLGKIGGARAVEVLAGYLDDPDLGYDAVMDLGDTGDNSAIPYLEECLRRNDYGLSLRAAEALGKIGTPEAEQVLIAALHNPSGDSGTLQRVAIALGTFKDRDAIDALIACRTKVVYTQVVNIGPEVDSALISMGADTIEPVLLRLSEHDEQNDRPWLIYILGEIKDNRSVGPLIAIIQDKDDECRENAAEALGKIGDESAVEPLIAAMWDFYGNEQDEFDNFGNEAAEALAAIGNERAITALLSALDSYHDVYTRMEIAGAVSMIDDPRCAERMDKALNDRDLTVIAGAIDYYIRQGKEGSEEALIATLKDFSAITVDYLYNSGNETLKEAALKWAGENGFSFLGHGYGAPTAWGSGD